MKDSKSANRMTPRYLLFAFTTLLSICLGFWFGTGRTALAMSAYATLPPVLLGIALVALLKVRRRLTGGLLLAVLAVLAGIVVSHREVGASPADIVTGRRLFVLRCTE